MTTLNNRQPRLIDADTESYRFHARVSGDLRQLLKDVRAIMAYRNGAEPSHAQMLATLLKPYRDTFLVRDACEMDDEELDEVERLGFLDVEFERLELLKTIEWF